MSSIPPFIDESSGSLDTDQLLVEIIPLGKLIALVGVCTLLPFGIATTFGFFRGIFIFVAQFIFAVGASIVLMYIFTRAIQLAEE